MTSDKKSDLISRSEAEKLGATCLARRNENGQLEAIISLDNAPTVEPQKVPIANVTFDTEKLKELTDEIVERIKSGEIVLQTETSTDEYEQALQTLWGRCQHCEETEKAFKVLRGERP